MRKIGQFLLANDRNAAFIALLFALLPFMNMPGGFVASIIVGLVTLHKGYKSGLFVLAWVALPSISLLVLRRFGVFDFLLLRCILVWAFALIFRAYASWRLLLLSMTILGAIVIFSMHFIIPDMQAWWVAKLTQYFNELSDVGVWKISANETKIFIARVASFTTGLVGFLVLMSTFVELLLARWWQSALFLPGQLRKEFTRIHLGRNASLIITVLLALSFIKTSIGLDFLPIFFMPFMIVGLSLLHLMVARNKNMFIVAIFIYIGIVFLPYIVVPLLAIAGYADSWFDFRKNLSRAENTKILHDK